MQILLHASCLVDNGDRSKCLASRYALVDEIRPNCVGGTVANRRIRVKKFVFRAFHAPFWLWACAVTQLEDFAGNELLQEIVIA